MEWLTNDPKIAERLRIADAHYEWSKAVAAGFKLDAKVAAYRRAKEVRDAAYAAIRRELEEG